jgi:hypothetical protein
MDATRREATVNQLRLARLMVELQRGKLMARRDACDELRESADALRAQALQVGGVYLRRREQAARSGGA